MLELENPKTAFILSLGLLAMGNVDAGRENVEGLSKKDSSLGALLGYFVGEY